LAVGQVLIEDSEHCGFARMLPHHGYQVHKITLPKNLHHPRVSRRSYNVFGEQLAAEFD
jgi:hypothetical protein